MPRKSATLSFDPATLTTRAQLRTAIGVVAHDKSNTHGRSVLEARMRQMDALDLLPRAWRTPTPAPKRTATTALLDQPATHLMSLERRADLDRVVRGLAADQDIDYGSALARFEDVAKAGREEFRSKPQSVGQTLGRAGVKSLDAFEADVKTLEQRDQMVARQVELEQAEHGAEAVDSMGRVRLAAGIDPLALKRDELACERRWHAAKSLDRQYESRATWEADDAMYLDAGYDLLRTLEQRPVAAAAQQRARTAAEALDAAAAAGRPAVAEIRALDQAAAALSARREAVAHGSAEPVKALDREDGPVDFLDLSGQQMLDALGLYGHARAEGNPISLDTAAEQIASGSAQIEAAKAKAAIPAARPDDPGITTPRGELDARVRSWMASHPGTNYLEALTAVTGVGLGGPWRAT
jgi:hypothetical protein